MVQVINKYDPMAHLGQLFGQGIGQGASQGVNAYVKKGMTDKALESLNPDAFNSPVDAIKGLLSATAGLDDQGRILQALSPHLLSLIRTKQEQNIDLTGKGDQPSEVNDNFERRGNVVSKKEPREKLPNFMNRKDAEEQDKFFPTNIGSNEAPGNLPQTATSGTPRHVLNGEQLIEKAQEIQSKFLKAGIPKSLEEAYKIASTQNDENKTYNQSVETERQQRVQSQNHYGDLAESELKRLYPESTSEQEAIFRKKGEEAAGLNKSEADTKRFLSKEAVKFKNSISSVQEALNAPRIQNNLSRSALGKASSLQQAMSDAKLKIKPLLDLGLYDTSRNLLSKSKFYPEEREKIIFGDLPKAITSTVKKASKGDYKENESFLKHGLDFFGGLGAGLKSAIPPDREYSDKSKNSLRENIKSVFETSPEYGETKQNKAVNLIQLRKQYEDQNYDWRVFKDALNDLFQEGEIDLTDDQMNQVNFYLNEPPLDNIEKILQKLNLRGR